MDCRISGYLLQAHPVFFQNCLKATKHRQALWKTKPLARLLSRHCKFPLKIEQFLHRKYSHMWFTFRLRPSHLNSKQTSSKFRDYARNHYLDRCRFIEDIPVTKGSVGYTTQRSLLCSGNILASSLLDGERSPHGQPLWTNETSNVGVPSAPKDLYPWWHCLFKLRGTSKEQANRSSSSRVFLASYLGMAYWFLLNKVHRAFILYFWYGAWNWNCPVVSRMP